MFILRLLISKKSVTYTIKWSYTNIWQVRVSKVVLFGQEKQSPNFHKSLLVLHNNPDELLNQRHLYPLHPGLRQSWLVDVEGRRDVETIWLLSSCSCVFGDLFDPNDQYQSPDGDVYMLAIENFEMYTET
jgi:hypothetical protein